MSKVKPGFRKSGFTVSRNPEITGTPTYNQVIDIINETVDKNAEFYEIEPAIVTKVYAEEKDLPLITNKDGNLVPNWKLLGTVEVELMEQGVSNNTNIKPLSQHIYQLPVIGEVINITEHDGELYYSFPLNTNNNVNMNLKRGGWLKEVPPETGLNRKVITQQGDTIFQGRYGQSIKFSSAKDTKGKNVFPNVKISNGQYDSIIMTGMKLADKNYPHIQNVNMDGSTIQLTSGDEVLDLNPSFQSNEVPPKLNGHIITLNSDKIIFNAKRNTDRHKQSGDIHFFGGRNINIGANEEINIEIPMAVGSKITMGESDSTNPIVKGDQLMQMFESLLLAMDTFSNVLVQAKGTLIKNSNEVDLIPLNDAAEKLRKSLNLIKTNFLSPSFETYKKDNYSGSFPRILSDKIFIS